ncbi:DUF4244 domain-containing protein [Arthrobacter sp. GCM10027362]|uniref:DUF4244 domain-containing protein n=1 Tax=Arthrobacter sp. GCM10027362 TaxID=3273379 RepID=UPI00362F3DA3
MLLALKKQWSRRTAHGADTNLGEHPQAAAACPVDDAPDEPLAKVIDLPGARRERTGKRGRQLLAGSDAGMATAEYAIATLAAVGFAGLLVLIMRSGEVRGLLMNIIEQALSVV